MIRLVHGAGPQRPGATRFDNIRLGRYATAVFDDLAERIIYGELPAGTELPSEAELGAEYGVSRTVIRDAMKQLEERRLIRIEHGRRSSVEARTAWNLIDPFVLRIALEADPDLSLIESVMNIRRAIECEATRAAATALEDADLARLAELIEAAAETPSYETFEALDHEFHEILLEASGNEIARTIIRAIHWQGALHPLLTGPVAADDLERTLTEHREIYAALVERDSERAAALLAAHVDRAWSARRQRALEGDAEA
jgi:GntR family galactonate operon transcriptional repressor